MHGGAARRPRSWLHALGGRRAARQRGAPARLPRVLPGPLEPGVLREWPSRWINPSVMRSHRHLLQNAHAEAPRKAAAVRPEGRQQIAHTQGARVQFARFRWPDCVRSWRGRHPGGSGAAAGCGRDDRARRARIFRVARARSRARRRGGGPRAVGGPFYGACPLLRTSTRPPLASSVHRRVLVHPPCTMPMLRAMSYARLAPGCAGADSLQLRRCSASRCPAAFRITNSSPPMRAMTSSCGTCRAGFPRPPERSSLRRGPRGSLIASGRPCRRRLATPPFARWADLRCWSAKLKSRGGCRARQSSVSDSCVGVLRFRLADASRVGTLCARLRSAPNRTPTCRRARQLVTVEAASSRSRRPRSSPMTTSCLPLWPYAE